MKRSKFYLALCVGLVSMWGFGTTLVTAETLVETTFEEAEFAVGDFIGDKANWMANLDDIAVITDSENQTPSGSKSLQLKVGAVVDRSVATYNQSSQVIWIEAYFKGPGSQADSPSYSDAEPASSIVHFSAANGIQMYDGTGASWVQATGHTSINDAKWYQVTLRQDYNLKKWDCFVDGAKQNSGALGFRDATLTKLQGFKSLSDTVSYLDDLRIVAAFGGDANGDDRLDSADLVRTIQIANSPTPSLSLIWGGNADVSGPTGSPDGMIDVHDIAAVTDLILGT